MVATRFTHWLFLTLSNSAPTGGQICLPFTGKPVLRYLRAIYNAIPQNMKGLKKLFPIHVVAIDNWDYVAGLHSIKRLDGTAEYALGFLILIQHWSHFLLLLFRWR